MPLEHRSHFRLLDERGAVGWVEEKFLLIFERGSLGHGSVCQWRKQADRIRGTVRLCRDATLNQEDRRSQRQSNFQARGTTDC